VKKLIVAPALILLWAAQSPAQEETPLRLAQTISLNGLQRHWDHFGVDVKSNRLFVTSGDEPVVDVIDMRTNKLIANIPAKPGARNARLVSELKKYYVNVSTKGAQEAQILVYDVVP
jgi:hypothetical protein